MVLLVTAQIARAEDSGGWLTSFSEEERRQLERGEIVIASAEPVEPDGESQRRMRAAMIVAQPVDLAWDTLADFERRPEFLPGAKEIRVVRREGDRVWL